MNQDDEDLEHLKHRHEVFRVLLKEYAETVKLALRTFTLINGGAAVAVATYLQRELGHRAWSAGALVSFASGVLLSALAIGLMFLAQTKFIYSTLPQYAAQQAELYAAGLRRRRIVIVVAALSLGTFFCGVICAFIAFLPEGGASIGRQPPAALIVEPRMSPKR